jgi:crotonobetainyl-CoA:carnitine CoA-transferase CaiB-like acyl-CoA transferase
MSDTRAVSHPTEANAGPLAGLTVIDACQLFAGPMAATVLGDYGADVIKIEHPKGDALRTTGYQKDGKGLWWKVVSRNKRCISLDLGEPEGADVLLSLARDADVLLEGFRPGTMERWGLGWDVLHELNPRLVMVRVSGFGQTGPYAPRPGFGTLAEALSGFAHLVGPPDGPPTLPPFGLGDGVAAMVAVWATMIALYNRDARGGDGQMVDLSLYEGLMFVVGPQITYYDQLGVVATRTGNRTPLNAPRNLYMARDGKWVAIAATGLNTPRRMLELVGHPAVADEPWFASARGRAEHVELLDELISPWIAERTRDEVMMACEAIGAAVAPVYDAQDIASDPHFWARTLVEVDDDDFGTIAMQTVLARLSETPGAIRWTGPAFGAHNDEIYRDRLGLTEERLSDLSSKGII